MTVEGIKNDFLQVGSERMITNHRDLKMLNAIVAKDFGDYKGDCPLIQYRLYYFFCCQGFRNQQEGQYHVRIKIIHLTGMYIQRIVKILTP